MNKPWAKRLILLVIVAFVSFSLGGLVCLVATVNGVPFLC